MVAGETAIYTYEDKSSPFRIQLKNGRVIDVIAEDIKLGSSLASEVKKLVTEEFKNAYNTHTHANSAAPPSNLMTNDHLTSTTKAK